MSSGTGDAAPARTDADTEPTADAQTVLDALRDATCREILRLTAAEPRSASDLAAACDRSRSTVYRKLDLLAEADLIRERVRLDGSGPSTLFAAREPGRVIRLDGDGVVHVE
ncbi:MAG: ArsR/SmtB family transcription factor [Halobacteriaceae archaeon]